MVNLLSLRALWAGYGEFEVLKGVDLEVGAGEIVALIGPNGAGKSTVLKAVFGLANVVGGKVVFNGEEITLLQMHGLLGLGISYVPQGKINFMDLTVEENLNIGGMLIAEPVEFLRRRDYVYQLFSALVAKKDEYAYTLSGGQQQMLALGRALMQQPKLLLLDEPSLGLSPKLQQELFSMLVRLRGKGVAILLVEQNAKKAIEVANKTYLLEDGKVVLSGGREILKNVKIKEVYLGGKYL